MRERLVSKLNLRKTELAENLKAKNLRLEKQHQIYGAINELELFLKKIEQSKDKDEPIMLLKPTGRLRGRK